MRERADAPPHAFARALTVGDHSPLEGRGLVELRYGHYRGVRRYCRCRSRGECPHTCLSSRSTARLCGTSLRPLSLWSSSLRSGPPLLRPRGHRRRTFYLPFHVCWYVVPVGASALVVCLRWYTCACGPVTAVTHLFPYLRMKSARRSAARMGGPAELDGLPPKATNVAAYRRHQRLRAASPERHLIGVGDSNGNGSMSSGGDRRSSSSEERSHVAAAAAAAVADHTLMETATKELNKDCDGVEDLSGACEGPADMAQVPARAAKARPQSSSPPLATRLRRRLASALGSISSDGSKPDSMGHASSLNQLSSSTGTASPGGSTPGRGSVASSRLSKRSRSSRTQRRSRAQSSVPEDASTETPSVNGKPSSQSSSRSVLSSLLLKRKSRRLSSMAGADGGGVDGRGGARSPPLPRGRGASRKSSSRASPDNAAYLIRGGAAGDVTARMEADAAAEAEEAAARFAAQGSASITGSRAPRRSSSRTSSVSRVSSMEGRPQYLEETDLGMTMIRVPDGAAIPAPGDPMPLSWQRLLFSLRGHVLTLHYMTPEDIVQAADEPFLRGNDAPRMALEPPSNSSGVQAMALSGPQDMVTGSLVDDDDCDDCSSDDPAAVGPLREATMEQLRAGRPLPSPSPARRLARGRDVRDVSGRQRAVSVVGSNVSSDAGGSAKAGSAPSFPDAVDEVGFKVQEASGVNHADVSEVTMEVDVATATFNLSGFPDLPPSVYALPDARHAARWKAATEVAGRRSIGDFYVMGKVLGAGAFGKVYEAEDRHTHDIHAVKVVSFTGGDARRDERVRREVAIVCELRHPGIVRTHRVIKLQRQVYFAMEVMRGGDLFDYCSSFPNLSEDHIVHIAQGILRSVAFLHSVGVVHRYVI